MKIQVRAILLNWFGKEQLNLVSALLSKGQIILSLGDIDQELFFNSAPVPVITYNYCTLSEQFTKLVISQMLVTLHKMFYH